MPKKKAGRPGADATRRKIVESAGRIFLERGFSNTSLEEVGEAAGVTKPTVYSHFGSKEGLLMAVVEAMTSELAGKFALALQSSGDCRADLHRFGQVFLEGVMNAEAIQFRRLAVMESFAHPELGEKLFRMGPAEVSRVLVRYLTEETKAGRLSCPDPTLAAEQFFGLLVGLHPLHVVIGQAPPSPSSRRKRVESGVEVFLAAYQVRKT